MVFSQRPLRVAVAADGERPANARRERRGVGLRLRLRVLGPHRLERLERRLEIVGVADAVERERLPVQRVGGVARVRIALWNARERRRRRDATRRD